MSSNINVDELVMRLKGQAMEIIRLRQINDTLLLKNNVNDSIKIKERIKGFENGYEMNTSNNNNLEYANIWLHYLRHYINITIEDEWSDDYKHNFISEMLMNKFNGRYKYNRINNRLVIS